MIKVVVFAALLGAIPSGLCADTRDARLAAARTHLAQTIEGLDIDRMVRQMYKPLLDQVRARGIAIAPEQEAEVDALYIARMRQPLIDILRAQDEIMADLMTLEEIEALSAFYASPVGSSVMRKLPEVTERQQPMIMEMVQTAMPAMMPEVFRILKLQ